MGSWQAWERPLNGYCALDRYLGWPTAFELQNYTNMDTRKSLALVLCTAAIITSGGLFKVLHWPGANLQLLVGGVVHVFALCLLAHRVWHGGALR
jgi:hypothetical protein